MWEKDEKYVYIYIVVVTPLPFLLTITSIHSKTTSYENTSPLQNAILQLHPRPRSSLLYGLDGHTRRHRWKSRHSLLLQSQQFCTYSSSDASQRCWPIRTPWDGKHPPWTLLQLTMALFLILHTSFVSLTSRGKAPQTTAWYEWLTRIRDAKNPGDCSKATFKYYGGYCSSTDRVTPQKCKKWVSTEGKKDHVVSYRTWSASVVSSRQGCGRVGYGMGSAKSKTS